MTVHRHHRLAAGARILAAVGLALGAVGAGACYTAGSTPPAGAGFVSREVLPIDRETARFSNLYEAIEHLRPEYLRVREDGPTTLTPVAYLNGARLADPTMLRQVPTWSVVDVRWVRPNQTSILYRSSHQLGGGIFVTTN
jgi:hypothetical protein